MKKTILYIISLFFALQSWASINTNGFVFKTLGLQEGLSNTTVNSICQDMKGGIWIATQDGLNFYNGKQFIVFRHKPSQANSIPNNTILEVNSLDSINIKIKVDGGSEYSFNTQTHQCILLEQDEEQKIIGDKNIEITALVKDRKGNTWIGTKSDGLIHLNKQRQRSTLQHDDNNTNSLIENEVRSIYVDQHDNVWIGTFGEGLDIYQPQSRIFNHLDNESNPGLVNDVITCIFEDLQMNIWIGTNNGISIVKNPYPNFEYFTEGTAGLSYKGVNAILKDSKERLWIGTDRGLNVMISGNMTFINYYKGDAGLEDDVIYTLKEDSKGRIWIGTTAGGLFLFNEEDASFTQYSKGEERGNLSHTFITCIHESTDGLLWLGTNGAGIDIFSPSQGKVIKHYNTSEGLSNEYITGIIPKGDKQYWVATWDGLNLIDTKNGFIKTYKKDGAKENGLTHKSITALYYDEDGSLWLATQNGLNKFNEETETVEAFIPSNAAINGMIEDNNKDIWLSTNDGIFMFNKTTETFTHFTIKDGLHNKQFKALSYHKDSNGKLYFGGVNGFNCFYPEWISSQRHIPLFISNINVLKENTSYPIAFSKENKLSEDITGIDVSFSRMELFPIQETKIEYLMEGEDDSWEETNNNKTIYYRNLSQGSYAFTIRLVDTSGKVIYQSSRYTFTIGEGGFNFSLILYLIIILAIIGLVISFAKLRKKTLESDYSEELKKLTTREKEVFILLSHGKSNKEIALELFIEPGTVKTHVKKIYKTLKINSRKEIVQIGELINKSAQ